jgi:hypothetical protein
MWRDATGYFLIGAAAASDTDFIAAKPFSKSPPTILSILTNTCMTFDMR